MVRRFTLAACVLALSLGSFAAGAAERKAPSEAERAPQPESIAEEAAEVSTVGVPGPEGSDADGMTRVEDEMNSAEDNDGCTGSIGNEDIDGCPGGDE